jgi:hypothetical protein
MQMQSINACWVLGVRPLCPCCGGRLAIGHTHGKAYRHRLNKKAKRSPGKPSRARIMARKLKHYGGYKSMEERLEWELPV